MPWWAWIVIGAIMFGSELAFVDAQFYLVFFGTAALIVGMVGLSGIAMPEWLQWLVFAGLSIASLVLFRKQLYDTLRKHDERMEGGPTGELVTLPVDLAPGASCRVEYRGSTWTAQNTSDHVLSADSQARIVNVDGLTLMIRPPKH
jgi:membrane protein implicated in regulation of membrane protease activity